LEYKITLIPGDGIGPEVTAAAVKVVEAAGVPIVWERVEAGQAAIDKVGHPLPDAVLESIRRNRAALKGPVTTPIGTGFASVNVGLRKALDLYVSLRPVKSLPGVKTRYENVDLVIVRENTEGLYSGREHAVVPGVVEGLKIITEKASRRIARFAFGYARAEGRRKVSIVHKANIMKLSDGLFLTCANQVAADFPFVQVEDVLIDHACMQVVMDPSRYDMLLMENLYGDLVSDLCAGLVGGLGLVPGANLGDHYAVFEAVHGSAPDIAGKGLANPTAVILSAELMLRHLGERKAAHRVREAVEAVLLEGKAVTPDLGGSATTDEMASAIAARIEEGS